MPLRVTAVVLAMLLGTTACSSTPVYPQDRACSLDTEIVSTLLGSDRFTAEEEELAGVPLAPSSTWAGRTSCLADHGDNRLIVEARIVDQATADAERAIAEDEDTYYEYRGGVGDSTAKGVGWTCGNVVAQIYMLEEPETQPDWQQLAEPVWDQVGCLTYSAPGESYQPEGWQ